MTDLEKVVNSIAEGDDLSTALQKHEPEPTCPHCGDPVVAIGTSISIQLVRDEATGKWSRDEIDYHETYQCLNCYEEFSLDDLDNFGVPNEIR